jgi:hypothetical protein
MRQQSAEDRDYALIRSYVDGTAGALDELRGCHDGKLRARLQDELGLNEKQACAQLDQLWQRFEREAAVDLLQIRSLQSWLFKHAKKAAPTITRPHVGPKKKRQGNAGCGNAWHHFR